MLTTVTIRKRVGMWLYTYTAFEVNLSKILTLNTINHSFNATQISMAIYRLTAAQNLIINSPSHVKFLQNKSKMDMRQTT